MISKILLFAPTPPLEKHSQITTMLPLTQHNITLLPQCKAGHLTSEKDENDNITPLMKSNFRCVPKFTRTSSLDGSVVNYAEKSVVLLRSLLPLFTTYGEMVIYPMCGSGAVAEACLSLNIDTTRRDHNILES